MSLVSSIIQKQIAKGQIARQEANQSIQRHHGVRGLGNQNQTSDPLNPTNDSTNPTNDALTQTNDSTNQTNASTNQTSSTTINDLGDLKTSLKAETTVGVISRKLARVGTTYGISRVVMGNDAKSYQDYGYGATSGWGTAIASSIVGTATNIGMFWGLEQSIGSPFVNEQESATIMDLFSNSITEWAIDVPIAIANAYHGYKRHNDSVGWGLGWLLFGELGLGIAQGFGKPLPEVSQYIPLEQIKSNQQGGYQQGGYQQGGYQQGGYQQGGYQQGGYQQGGY